MLTVYKYFFKDIKFVLTIGFIVTLWSTSALAQTDLKIGNAPGTITSSAVFEAASTNKGLLIPRMTTAEMIAISSPANGLMIYNTTDGCIYIYRTSVWLSTCSPTYAMAWGLLGNSGTTGGTNFIGTTDAQGLAFRTNNTEWMRMSTTGSIGLGLTTPSVKLHQDGGTATATYHKFTANTTTGQTTTDGFDVGIDATGNAVLKQNEALPMLFSTNAIEQMRITSAGNMGINTTTPSYKLDIDANTSSIGNPMRLQGLQAGAVSDSIVSSSSGILRRLSIAQVIGNSWNILGNSGTTAGTNFLGTTDAQGLAFRTNNTEWMRMSTTGSIGLGLTSPSVKLHLDGGTATATYQKFTANTTTGQLSTDGFDVGIDAAGNAVLKQNEALPIIISTNATERMRILSGGNIGINTTTPSYKLDIDAQTGSTGDPLRLLGLNAGATSDSIISSSSGILRRLSIAQVLGAGSWTTTGNASTVDGTNFLGTTDNIPLTFRVNNTQSGRIDNTLSNVSFGYDAGSFNTTGTYNTFMGHNAGRQTSSAQANTGIGYIALTYNTTGASNTALGSESLVFNTTGNNNTAAGRYSLRYNTTGTNSTAVGYSALERNTTGAFNTAIGSLALNANTTGNFNIAIGNTVLSLNTTGGYNMAQGYQSMYSNTTGNNNVALGYQSLYGNTTGNNNAVVGMYALGSNSTAWGNSAFGYRAAFNVTTGGSNVAIGDSSIHATTTGGNNVALGYRAGLTLTTGSNNTFLGYGADVSSAALTNATALGYSSIVGASNSFVLGGTGANAVNVGINTTTPQYKLDIDAQTGSAGNPLRLLGLNAGSTADSIVTSSSGILRRLSIAQVLGAGSWTTTGNASTVDGTNFIGTTDNIPFNIRVNNQKSGRIDNTNANAFFGYQAGNSTTGAGQYNSFFGNGAGGSNTTGANNTAVGSDALVASSTGYSNVAVGRYGLRLNTTGYANIAIGHSAMEQNTTGYNNVAIGFQALLQNTTAGNNTAIGAQAMLATTTGTNNVSLGYQSLYFNTTGSTNTALGLGTLYGNSSGNNNTAVGTYTLGANTTAWGNTGLGHRAAFSTTTGQANVAVGDSALYVHTTGSNNVALGYRAGLTLTTGSQNTFLGATSDVSSATYSNATAVGYGASVTASNKIRLGNSSVTLVETSGSFVTVSDRRLKTNIEDNYIGLNFIKAMRPVKYELKAQKGIVYDGFIAQEIDSIMQKQNIKTFSGLAKPANTEGYYTVSYATFVVPLVNAVKELDAKSEKLKVNTEKLTAENADLKAELDRMKAENAALKANVDKNTQDIEAIKAALKKQ